jgi:hypothetical protein
MSDLPEGYTLLWKTEVGSGMWGTDRNDLDLMAVYCVDTNKILRGENIRITMPHRKYRDELKYGDIDVEEQAQELGHLVNKLIDGNVNAIWSVCSPKIIESPYCGILWDLQKIVCNNLSRMSYHSIKGMSMSQYYDNEKRAAVMPPGKAYCGALRVANFGCTLLADNKLEFKGIDTNYIPTEDEVLAAILSLDNMYKISDLPEKPNEDLFRDFLYHVRLGFFAEKKQIRDAWGEQNRWVNDGDKLKGKCIDEIKNKVTKLMRETDYIEGDYYTCNCGIEIHPQELLNLRAIHCKSCQYGKLIRKELEKCGQPIHPPGGWINSGSLHGEKMTFSKDVYKDEG